jgi:nucleotidyltransferase/DNA polymerase involved in DNA repair
VTAEVSRDLRATISETADQVLEAYSLATGKTKQALVRTILDEWADARIHEANLVQRLAPRDGKPRSASE